MVSKGDNSQTSCKIMYSGCDLNWQNNKSQIATNENEKARTYLSQSPITDGSMHQTMESFNRNFSQTSQEYTILVGPNLAIGDEEPIVLEPGKRRTIYTQTQANVIVVDDDDVSLCFEDMKQELESEKKTKKNKKSVKSRSRKIRYIPADAFQISWSRIPGYSNKIEPDHSKSCMGFAESSNLTESTCSDTFFNSSSLLDNDEMA